MSARAALLRRAAFLVVTEADCALRSPSFRPCNSGDRSAEVTRRVKMGANYDVHDGNVQILTACELYHKY